MIRRLGALGLVTLGAPLLQAQDGGQLYATYCAACHGTNGEGALNGQFPPLAGSPWPVGTPDRSIKIVLAGLHGEVDVNGRTWNLEMPPQGAALADDQIAAILSYVRGSWGNKATPITTDQVAGIRKATANRTQPWTQGELLKLHPLDRKPALADLISYVYDGVWKDTPDFSTLKPVAVEEEHAGLISLKKTGRKDHFGVVWEGTLALPDDADYEFHFDGDDGGRFRVDGNVVAEIGGVGPIGSRAQQKVAKLTKGNHKVRVEYYEFEGQEELRLGWRKKGDKQWTWLSDQSAPRSKWPEIPVVASNGKAAVYRNFIQGTTPKSIAFGFPNQVSMAWSIDHFGPELLWTGEFMDGGHHWTDRGQGAEPPAGENVVKIAGANTLPDGAKFRGYQLDPAGNPTFVVQSGSVVIQDAWKPTSYQGKPALERTLTQKGDASPRSVLLSDKLPLTLIDKQTYAFGDKLLLHVEHAEIEAKDGKSFLALKAGEAATLTYFWR